MRFFSILLLIAIFLFSCTKGNTELYSFKFENILEVSDWNELEIKIPGDKKRRPGQKPYDDIKDVTGIEYRYHVEKFRDSIVAIYDIENAGCLEIVPYSQIIRDTLILEYGFNGDGCKEDEIYRLKYVVKRNSNYRFIRFYNRVYSIRE